MAKRLPSHTRTLETLALLVRSSAFDGLKAFSHSVVVLLSLITSIVGIGVVLVSPPLRDTKIRSDPPERQTRTV